ncbi:MAG: OmpA family protein [Clostridiales bacterium]|nr:OmpA family protein [Clostridiales bacterium]
MARQRIHNRRAGRGSLGGGASWISYSDMMAALLLIFVLILAYSLFQYFSMLEVKTKELEEQKVMLNLAQDELNSEKAKIIIIQADLDEKTAQLEEQQLKLDVAEEKLNSKEQELIVIQADLDTLQAVLQLKQQDLDAATLKLEEQQAALTTQARRIDDLIGLRTTMIRELSLSLSAANLKATVDPNTGDIMLDSSVFFETGKSSIKQEGKDLLDRFIPVYLDVLLRPEYSNYLGEIIIEGHTDSQGTYESNLKLSQDRALQVALYCLNMPSLTRDQKNMLKQILTAKGRSYSDLILNADGSENADASRRVEFKFSLRDSDMIDELNKILSSQEE